MSDTLPGANISTELTKECNRFAADRTLMAWIRTSLSLIGFEFGFGIGKLSDYLKSTGEHSSLDPIRSTKIFGGSFIILGMLALLAAVIGTLPYSEAARTSGFCVRCHAANRRDSCGHAAFDWRIRLRRDSSVTALLGHQLVLAGSSP